MFNEAKRYFLFVLWFTPMNWKSWSVASKCRKTHPCDYRISKFSWGACPRNPLGGKALPALPILCPGVKLSCPPVQNLNEPPDWMVNWETDFPETHNWSEDPKKNPDSYQWLDYMSRQTIYEERGVTEYDKSSNLNNSQSLCLDGFFVS